MKLENKAAVLRGLQTIPGVGRSIASDLWNLGVRSVADLRSRDPEKLFDRLCSVHNQRIDRCMLYVFRCAVYFASERCPDPEKLKWWNWKDAKLKPIRSGKRS